MRQRKILTVRILIRIIREVVIRIQIIMEPLEMILQIKRLLIHHH